MIVMTDPPTFWFPAKRYGWGWGLPVRWQGWVVLAAYAALLFAGIDLFKARRDSSSLLLYFVVLTAVLVAIIAFKGEGPLRWRWGKE
jgi:hypothetical protein